MTIAAILAFLSTYWPYLATAYEIGVRLYPTNKDLSLLNKIMAAAEVLVPNLAKGGGTISSKLNPTVTTIIQKAVNIEQIASPIVKELSPNSPAAQVADKVDTEIQKNKDILKDL